MGRYYTGDIEGKFWFAVQSSDAPSRFGGESYEPQFVEYMFDKDEHYEGVCKEVEKIKERLGQYKEKFDVFFSKHNGYNDEMLIEDGFPKDEVRQLLGDYADLELGEKIKKCLEKVGACRFEAEL